MAELSRSRRLRKELKLLDIYAVATGTTLSAGFFLLPGLAATYAGPAIVLAYLVAAIPLIPAMFSIIELGTAMPRAGGVYYFVDRSLGPFVGMIGGLGTWCALILKVSFALVGMGAYVSLFVPGLAITPVAIALAVILGFLNALGAKKSGGLQVYLVSALLIILLGFIAGGLTELDPSRFRGLFSAGFSSLLSTAGLVYISYVGVTNVASLSEEVAKPERNLPRGIILALATALVIYGLGTAVMVGVIPMDRLQGDLTPVATAANLVFGTAGAAIVSVAALLAFVSVANAGTMSASRYPLAMSRDHMVPRVFGRLGRRGTPVCSIAVTVAVIVTVLLTFDPTGIAKLASAFQLLMFALVCVAVIVMRESRIESYDPGYHSPLYPWMQIAGIVTSIALIIEMGWLPSLFTTGLILVSSLWYRTFARHRVMRTGAMYHVFERLGRARHHGLERELRGILKEKGLRDEDPFDDVVSRGMVIDLEGRAEFEDVSLKVAEWLSGRVPHTAQEIQRQLLEGTRTGATPVTHQVALPHLRIDGLAHPEIVLVRSRHGVHIRFTNPLTAHEDDEATVHALFFLVSPEDNPGQHLRILAQIAERVDDDSFPADWDSARDEQGLRDALLRHERYLFVDLRAGDGTAPMIGRRVRDLKIPEGCLITWLRRGEEVIVPRGNTVLQEGDRLTLIGEPADLKAFAKRYEAAPS